MAWPRKQKIGFSLCKRKRSAEVFAFKAYHLDLELGSEFEARARKARYDAVMRESRFRVTSS